MSLDLSKRRVLVTGSGNGLGLGIARALAAAGAAVALTDVDPIVLDRAREEAFAGRARAFIRDLAAPDAPALLIRDAVGWLGSLDTLINCAAWSLHRPLDETTISDFDRLVAVNQRAPYFLIQEFAAQVTESSGDPCVVNIASVNALVGNRDLTAYAATKAALVAMTRALAVELAPRIRVLAISPATVRTQVTDQLIQCGQLDPTAHFEKYLVKRFITVEEIAEMVMFLLGPAAASITGSNWVIDGGYTTQ